MKSPRRLCFWPQTTPASSLESNFSSMAAELRSDPDVLRRLRFKYSEAARHSVGARRWFSRRSTIAFQRAIREPRQNVSMKGLHIMRAMRADRFNGYQDLKLVEIPKPAVSDGRVLVRLTAAGVTPLDYTILSGGHPRAKAPLVLGNEGAGVIEDAGDSGLAVGRRVMFTGPYGVRENGAWQEWLLVRPDDLALVPDAIGDVVAASLPVAYLTAQITLTLAGFKPGMTVLAPGIGGSVGNATYQLARAQGADKVISTAGSTAKAARARELGFENVIDLTTEGLAEGV